MADTKQLVQTSIAANADAVVYTTPVSKTTILKEVTICNPSSVNVYFSMNIPSGEAGVSNAIFNNAFISAGQTNIIAVSSVLPYGKFLYMKVDPVTTGGFLNILATGVELSGSSAKQLATTLLSTDDSVSRYTVPALKTAVMYQAMFTNVSNAATTISLYIASAGSPAATTTNCILSQIPIAVGETVIYESATSLPTGSVIFAICGVNSAVNLTIDGTEK